MRMARRLTILGVVRRMQGPVAFGVGSVARSFLVVTDATDPAAVRAFGAELRRAAGDLRGSCARMGVDRLWWSLVPADDGEWLVAGLEGGTGADPLRRLAVSVHPFDLWLKERWAELSGTRLTLDAPIPVGELLADADVRGETTDESVVSPILPVSPVASEPPLRASGRTRRSPS